jgi:hypothetical protein
MFLRCWIWGSGLASLSAKRALGDAASADRNLARARAIWAGDLAEMPLSRI